MSYLPEVSMPPTQPISEAEPPETANIPTPTTLRPTESSPDEKYEVDGDGEPIYDDEGCMTFGQEEQLKEIEQELTIKEIIKDESSSNLR